MTPPYSMNDEISSYQIPQVQAQGGGCATSSSSTTTTTTISKDIRNGLANYEEESPGSRSTCTFFLSDDEEDVVEKKNTIQERVNCLNDGREYENICSITTTTFKTYLMNIMSKLASYSTYIKYGISVCLVTSVLGLIITDIFEQNTPMSQATSPIFAFLSMWIVIIMLGVLEGLQGCLVGLQPIDKKLYKISHPTTYHQCSIIYTENNLNRFIVGRQFLVVLAVFCLNLCCASTSIISCIAVMIITVVLGQLSSEVNATNCMLDFINTTIALITTYVCLAIESSGLLHSVYLIECFFTTSTTSTSASETITEEEVEEEEEELLSYHKRNIENGTTTTQVQETQQPPRPSVLVVWWYRIRVFASFCFLSYAMIVSTVALINEQTEFIQLLPTSNTCLTMTIFIWLICFLGILEGIQIAVFAVVNLPEEALNDSPAAICNSDLVFSGNNFKAFLIGRQICVTTCMFLLARMTTTIYEIDGPPGPLEEQQDTDIAETILHFQEVFFNTGLPGALITTIVASLFWRIIAASFPVAFMANPIVSITIRLCLLLEASGVFSASLLLGDAIKYLLGFQLDEGYIGCKQEHGKCLDKLELEYEISTTASTVSTNVSSSSSSEEDDDAYDEESVFASLKSHQYGATTQ